MDTHWTERYRYWFIVGILSVGFALRLAGLVWGQAYSYFEQGDGIEAYSVAVDYGSGEARAQYIGQPNYNEKSKLPGPLWAVFCFLGLRFGGSIHGVLWGILLLNTAFIYLVFVLAEKTISTKAAYAAALLAATEPWAVYYSVGVYNPNIMAFLGALLCLSLWEAARVDRSKAVGFVPLLLAVMPQVHMSGLMLIPAAVVVLLASGRRLNTGWLCCGVAAGAMLYIPYIRGEMSNGWQNTHGMFSGKGRYSWDCLKAFITPLGFLVNWTPQWSANMRDFREMARACCGSIAVVALFGVVSAVMTGLLLFGLWARARAALNQKLCSPREWFRQAPGLTFLSIMIVIPLGLVLLNGKGFHTRYFLVLLGPFLALVGAGAAMWWEDFAQRQVRWSAIFNLSLTVTICFNLWLIPAMFHFQGRQIQDGPVFLPSWNRLEALYQALKRDAGDKYSVQVDDSSCRPELEAKGPFRGAAHIRDYVLVREKEVLLASRPAKPPVVFRLYKVGDEVTGATAYEGQGIKLVRIPAQ